MRPVEVELCAGTACHLMGSQDLMTLVNNLRETHGNRLQIKLTHCLGDCGHGPNARINGVLYSKLTEEKLEAILTEVLTQDRGVQ